MGLRGTIVAAVLAVIAVGVVATGCGGSSSDASDAAGASSFLKSANNKKTVNFGQEADDEEREAASSVLEENMEARAAGDWAKQCATLSPRATKSLEEENAERGEAQGSCAKDLEFQGEPKSQTASIRANTMTGPIDALRIKGDRGYALYHGAKGKDYAMPMEKVDGEWKVDDVVTEEL
jgi:hypothetical protein